MLGFFFCSCQCRIAHRPPRGRSADNEPSRAHESLACLRPLRIVLAVIIFSCCIPHAATMDSANPHPLGGAPSSCPVSNARPCLDAVGSGAAGSGGSVLGVGVAGSGGGSAQHPAASPGAEAVGVLDPSSATGSSGQTGCTHGRRDPVHSVSGSSGSRAGVAKHYPTPLSKRAKRRQRNAQVQKIR